MMTVETISCLLLLMFFGNGEIQLEALVVEFNEGVHD